MTGRSSDVDAWLAAQPQPFRDKLAELRDLIHELVPGAGERIAYGIPIVTLTERTSSASTPRRITTACS